MASLKAKLVAKELLERVRKGQKVNMQELQKKHGYSATSAQAMKVTKTKSFHDILNKAGLTDDFLAQKHSDLMNSQRLCEYEFRGNRIEKTRKVKEDDGTPSIETYFDYIPLKDEQIKEIIESTPGCTLLHVVDIGMEGTKRAYYRAPDGVAQDKALEKAYKIKGHFTADRPNPEGDAEALPVAEQQRLKKLLNLK